MENVSMGAESFKLLLIYDRSSDPYPKDAFLKIWALAFCRFAITFTYPRSTKEINCYLHNV